MRHPRVKCFSFYPPAFLYCLFCCTMVWDTISPVVYEPWPAAGDAPQPNTTGIKTKIPVIWFKFTLWEFTCPLDGPNPNKGGKNHWTKGSCVSWDLPSATPGRCTEVNGGLLNKILFLWILEEFETLYKKSVTERRSFSLTSSWLCLLCTLLLNLHMAPLGWCALARSGVIHPSRLTNLIIC